MEESRLRIARKKNNLTQKEAAKILGISPQALSSAETGKSELHRRNFEKVAKEFGVSFAWLVTGEGSDAVFVPEDIGAGSFVRVVNAEELLTGERTKESKYVFVPGSDQLGEALGYSTKSELPPSVVESTFVFVPADFTKHFENGKLYLMAIEGMLIVRRVEKVIFGERKGMFKLTGLDGEVDFLKGKGVVVWRVVFRLDRLE